TLALASAGVVCYPVKGASVDCDRAEPRNRLPQLSARGAARLGAAIDSARLQIRPIHVVRVERDLHRARPWADDFGTFARASRFGACSDLPGHRAPKDVVLIDQHLHGLVRVRKERDGRALRSDARATLAVVTARAAVLWVGLEISCATAPGIRAGAASCARTRAPAL